MSNEREGAVKRLTAIDLFSGAGGFSEGLEQAGVHVLLAQELHPQPALTHVFNHPGTVGVVGDVRKLDPQLLKQLLRRHHGTDEVDIIVGGPPCQGFSTAGKKNEHDPRNTLFDDYCNIVAAIRPRAIVLENVPGFKKMYGGKMYLAARERFEAMGYDVDDSLVNAVNYGLPQRRLRFVLIGVRRGEGLRFSWPQPTHLNPEAGPPDLFTTAQHPHVSIRDALSDLDFIDPGEEGHRHSVTPESAYQRARRRTDLIFNHLASKHREKAVRMFSLIPEGSTINCVPDEAKSAKRTMARMDRNHISNTVLALPDDFIHYRQDRIPTVREMARLQSFDDDFVFIGKRTSGFVDRKHDVPQYTQVGNAVPPLLARAIGVELVKMLGGCVRDVRDLEARARRLEYVHGSSGFAGYTLSPEIADEIALYSIDGNRLDLPVDGTARPVHSHASVSIWAEKRTEGPRRQWAPGVPKPQASLFR